jgi:PAS domain S-box-containing protein
MRILDAAITITGAAKGNIQLLDLPADKLVIAVQRGFDRPFLQFFATVEQDQTAACAAAKKAGQRILVQDVMSSDLFAGQPAREVLLTADVRAVQSTPLISSAGTVLGMISTHFPAPHNFPDRDLRLVDLLARQAADYLERKRTSEGLALLAAIVENSDDAIITKNLDGIITSWNRGAERIFGYTAGQTVGKHISLLIPPERLDEEPRILDRLRRGERVDHFETVRRHKNGTLLNISLTISPVRDSTGQIIGASKIARDITELLNARQALARSHQELEQRVSERTASLQQALAQMQDFTYSVSHDLRAPARVISGLAGAAIEDHGPSLAPDLRATLEKISRSAQRMEQLIRDILEYSRIARADVILTSVELDRLIPAVTGERPDLQPPGVEITLRKPLAAVLAHEPSLSQIVTNLLDNAVKFVHKGTTPKIQFWTERQNGSVRLWVKDNGIGIKPKYQDRLFHLFERAHQSPHYEGTGVGLAIVRKAAEKMGGTVGVVSDGSSGSSFWIELLAAPL